jgi:hypothetical protein
MARGPYCATRSDLADVLTNYLLPTLNHRLWNQNVFAVIYRPHSSTEFQTTPSPLIRLPVYILLT